MKLFFDTETTGKANFKSTHTDDKQPHIVQIGALLTTNAGEEVSSMDVIIKPEGWTISEEASDIHGITTEFAEHAGVPLESALYMFQCLVDRADQVIAHNISFDYLILCAAFHRISKSPVWPAKFCTMEATTNICKLPAKWPGAYKWPKLTEAYFHFFGKHVENAHSAIVDVRACKEIYFALFK